MLRFEYHFLDQRFALVLLESRVFMDLLEIHWFLLILREFFGIDWFLKNSYKINKNLWTPRRSIKTRLSRRTSAKRWSRKWYSNLCAMKSDAVYALSKGTSQHSAMPVQATTPPCPHVANVPPKRNNFFFNRPPKNLFLIASRHYAAQQRLRTCGRPY